MRQAVILLVLAVLALEAGKVAVGREALVEVVYGAVALMSLMISATFLWLWGERATPLALGMSFSWLGAGLFAAGFWLVDLLGLPFGPWREDTALVALAVYIVGALLHFAVIHRSFGRHGMAFLWPVLAAITVSAAVVAALGG